MNSEVQQLSPSSVDSSGDVLSRINSLKRKSLEAFDVLISSNSLCLSPKRLKHQSDLLENFRKRLATFKGFHWRSEQGLNPRFFAERGWSVVDEVKRTLKCNTCGRFINVGIPELTKVGNAVYDKCLRLAMESADNGHEKNCSTKSTSINFFPHLNEKRAVKKELIDRFNSMKDVKFPKDFKIEDDDSLREEVVTNIFGAESGDMRLKQLAMLGFGNAADDATSVECSLCLRRLSLYAAVSPVSAHCAWCPLLDACEPLNLPQWRTVLSLFSPVRKPLSEHISVTKRAFPAPSISSPQ